MSLHAQAWVAKIRQPISEGEAHLLYILADYADDQGVCWPSMETLARRCRINRATVYRRLERLQHHWRLVVKDDSGKQRGRSNRYRLQIDAAPHWPLELTDEQYAIAEVRGREELQASLDLDLSDVNRVLRGATGGVAPRDTPVVHRVSRHATPGVAPDATGEVLHHATPGVAPDATGGVAPDATRTVNNHQRTISACVGGHLDEFGDPTDCGADVAGCSLFAIPDAVKQSGLEHIAEIRARLASRHAGTDERPSALEARAS